MCATATKESKSLVDISIICFILINLKQIIIWRKQQYIILTKSPQEGVLFVPSVGNSLYYLSSVQLH